MDEDALLDSTASRGLAASSFGSGSSSSLLSISMTSFSPLPERDELSGSLPLSTRSTTSPRSPPPPRAEDDVLPDGAVLLGDAVAKKGGVNTKKGKDDPPGCRVHPNQTGHRVLR